MPVVDASVALKWLVGEPDSPLAVSLRDAHIHGEAHVAAPDLLIYEVANALLHHPHFPEREIERAISTLYDLQLELVVPTVGLVHAVVHLATHHKLTFYDALYVGLAQELGMELITADRHLYHRTVRYQIPSGIRYRVSSRFVLTGNLGQEGVDLRLQGGDGEADLLKLREPLGELGVFDLTFDRSAVRAILSSWSQRASIKWSLSPSSWLTWRRQSLRWGLRVCSSESFPWSRVSPCGGPSRSLHWLAL